ncbi:MAG: lysylphosphatidylglycerol synthase transmembrane domain-containing protein [Proteobacteria bacterium]|nr:lysylphosphatidylglycerol synthase transmembrane domain-containing protein [Pseudomonadota bacterium]
MKRKNIVTISGFIISIVMLYFSLKDINAGAILETLKKTDCRLVFIPLIFIAIAIMLSSFKWQRISGGNVKFSDTFVSLMIGLFVNNVLPARIGEIARGYVLSKRTGISFTYAISTVFVDRIFDLAGLLLITLLFFPKHSLPVKISQAIYILIGLLTVCIILIIALSRERFANAIAGQLSRIQKPFLAKFAKRIIEIQGNLKRIQSPLNIILFIIIAFLQWLSMSTALYFVMLTLGVKISFIYVPFVCALLNMGLTIPSSPGYIGVYQFMLVYLLSIFDVPKYEGFAVSVLFHALWYIPYNLIGFSLLLKEHLKIGEIRKLEKQE